MVAEPTNSPPVEPTEVMPANGGFYRVPRSSRVELGDTGVNIFSGILYPRDYNTEWSVPGRYKIIDQMRNDATVAAALRAVKLPLMRARHYVDAADDTPLAKEQAEWVEHQLFEYMYGTFADFQRHALMALDYGSYPHEVVLHVKDSPDGSGPRVCLEKLGPRHPASVYEWHLTMHGELDFIVQQLSSDLMAPRGGDTGFPSYGGAGNLAKIPASSLLVFVNEQEGADFTGRSLLRPVYKPYWYKQGMEAVDAVAKEKRASGIDVMYLEEAATPDDQSKAEAALATVRTHQHNYMTIPKGRMEYKIEGIGAGSVLSTMETMEHHDLRILRAFFTEFLAMGPSGSGGLAEHADKTKFLLMLVEAIGADMFLETVNTHLIPRLIQYNWGPQEAYPKLCHGKIDVRDLAALADGLFKLTQAGFLHPRPDGEDEEFIRSMYDMPDAPPPGTYPVASPAAPVPGPGASGPNPQPVDGYQEPPQEIAAVQAKQLATLRSLASRHTDVNEVVNLSVPYKAEVAQILAGASRDPEVLIQSRTRAEVFAGQLKSQVVREWSRKAQ